MTSPVVSVPMKGVDGVDIIIRRTLPLNDGVEIGTLVELAQWTLSADKVLTF